MLIFPATAKTAIGAGIAAMTLASAAVPVVALAQTGDPCESANIGGGAVGAVAGAAAGSNLARGGGRTGGAIIGGVLGALVGSAAARGASNCAAPPRGYYPAPAVAQAGPPPAYYDGNYGAAPPPAYYAGPPAYYAAPPVYYAPEPYYYGPSVGLFLGGGRYGYRGYYGGRYRYR